MMFQKAQVRKPKWHNLITECNNGGNNFGKNS